MPVCSSGEMETIASYFLNKIEITARGERRFPSVEAPLIAPCSGKPSQRIAKLSFREYAFCPAKPIFPKLPRNFFVDGARENLSAFPPEHTTSAGVAELAAEQSSCARASPESKDETVSSFFPYCCSIFRRRGSLTELGVASGKSAGLRRQFSTDGKLNASRPSTAPTAFVFMQQYRIDANLATRSNIHKLSDEQGNFAAKNPSTFISGAEQAIVITRGATEAVVNKMKNAEH